MENKVRFFIDMDGTIARFHEAANCLEQRYNPKFYIRLNPYENVIHGLLQWSSCLVSDNFKGMYVLSAVDEKDSKRIIFEKQEWIHQYFPIIPEENLLFIPIGMNKAQAVKEKFHQDISCFDFLLDDYTFNLRQWRDAGGSSIKLVNEINDTGKNGPLWNGERIRFDYDAERIKNELNRIVYQGGDLVSCFKR